jgi:tetratricopeptide (TPR) repeat protein
VLTAQELLTTEELLTALFTAPMQAATRLDPRNAAAINMLGLCYTSQGDLQDGIKAYERALRLDPGLKDAWSNLATAHKEARRFACCRGCAPHDGGRLSRSHSSLCFLLLPLLQHAARSAYLAGALTYRDAVCRSGTARRRRRHLPTASRRAAITTAPSPCAW